MKEVDKEKYEEVVEKAAAHMKMGLKSHMSCITLRMQSGSHSQTKQEKG